MLEIPPVHGSSPPARVVAFQAKDSLYLFYVGIFPMLFRQTLIIHLENVPMASFSQSQSTPRILSRVTLSGFSENQCKRSRGSRGQGEGPGGHAGAAQFGSPGPGLHQVLGLRAQLIPPELAPAARPGEGSRGGGRNQVGKPGQMPLLRPCPGWDAGKFRKSDCPRPEIM